ncbi:MAG: hypothetical protein WKF89_04365 [Chitinophagaceae bacterium]
MKIKKIIPAFFLVAFLAFALEGIPQDITALLMEAKRLEQSKKENDAFKKYLEVLVLQPGNMVALCKASELCSMIGNRQIQKSSKLDYFNAARGYAASALKINSNFPEANFVMSLAMGRLALVLNGKEKILAVNDIKKYAEKVVRIDPSNFKAFHVLGKWHYEISSLSSITKMGAKIIFGGLPPSSFSESIKFYEKSRALNPDFALNYLEVAKAYHKNDQDKRAIKILRKLQTIPEKNSDDPLIQQEGKQLLKELRGT